MCISKGVSVFLHRSKLKKNRFLYKTMKIPKTFDIELWTL